MEEIKKFIKPEGHNDCKCSTNIADEISFGKGELDEYGFWSIPCNECARAWEKQYPEMGKCWPHEK